MCHKQLLFQKTPGSHTMQHRHKKMLLQQYKTHPLSFALIYLRTARSAHSFRNKPPRFFVSWAFWQNNRRVRQRRRGKTTVPR
ncbi:hypothetical protein, partial [Desulfovibrio sp.]|uniref:hypothetical protein n=1 Tax=Desulfovibrio sp. TaxID=885 RepID=UPI0025BC2A36